jgi:hypothetical protein
VKHLGHQQPQGGVAAAHRVCCVDQGDLVSTALQVPGRRAADDAATNDRKVTPGSAQRRAQICLRSSWT